MEEFITKDLNPLLRGWANYYRKTEVCGILEELDRGVRRRLRCILWRSWKRARTRARRLIAGGVAAEHAWACAYNGRGPWHNAGSQAMNTACPTALFTRMGLVSLTQIIIQPRA